MVNRVFVLANDVVPGCGVPVAAPGLRAHGLAAGLREHDFDVTTVVPRYLLERVWEGSTPPPLAEGTIALNGSELGQYLANQGPATVVFSNSNQVQHLSASDDLRYVLDMFAPKMLELAYQYPDQHPRDQLAALRKAKIEAFRLADAVIVNGTKKRAYALAWILQTDRDPRSVLTAIVNMAIPGTPHIGSTNEEVRMGVAGYLQGWSLPGEWMDHLTNHLEHHPAASLEVLLPSHWGGEGTQLSSPRLDRLIELENVTTHPVMRFHEFQAFMATIDVAIDLFTRSLEREYAMVTRTVVALACGVPVIHPPFTEVSSFIAEYDAGWLVDADDLAGFTELISSITIEEARLKSANATRLFDEVFAPAPASQPLADIIRTLWVDHE